MESGLGGGAPATLARRKGGSTAGKEFLGFTSELDMRLAK